MDLVLDLLYRCDLARPSSTLRREIHFLSLVTNRQLAFRDVDPDSHLDILAIRDCESLHFVSYYEQDFSLYCDFATDLVHNHYVVEEEENDRTSLLQLHSTKFYRRHKENPKPKI